MGRDLKVPKARFWDPPKTTKTGSKVRFDPQNRLSGVDLGWVGVQTQLLKNFHFENFLAVRDPPKG